MSSLDINNMLKFLKQTSRKFCMRYLVSLFLFFFFFSSKLLQYIYRGVSSRDEFRVDLGETFPPENQFFLLDDFLISSFLSSSYPEP